MRLAELSSRSGMSTATIKYYLRLGLLAPGRTESSTWSSYDEAHLRRLRLIRALTDVAGLSLEEIRHVVAAVDDKGLASHARHGAVQWALSPAVPDPSEGALARVDALLERHDWKLVPGSPHRRTLAAALDALDALDFPPTDEVLDAYVRALGPVARVELARVAREDAETAAEHVVVGTLLYEPVLVTLRRIAHEVSGPTG